MDKFITSILKENFPVDTKNPKRVAIMQPYLFPYIGYYQLVASVDVFVFYDDVNSIKGGWINRNKILTNNKHGYFTIPLKRSSPNKKINEIESLGDNKKLKKTINQTYSKAPYFNYVYPRVNNIFEAGERRISELSIQSVITVFDYLKLRRNFIARSLIRTQLI